MPLEIYEPQPEDSDPDAEALMHMGKEGDDNDLRDPWFHTPEGQAWLAEQGEG